MANRGATMKMKEIAGVEGLHPVVGGEGGSRPWLLYVYTA